MQKICGSSMAALDPKSISQGDRQAIMKQVIDAKSAIYSRDITHRDWFPRNIMITVISDAGLASKEQRTVAVDFGKVQFGRSRQPMTPSESENILPGTISARYCVGIFC